MIEVRNQPELDKALAKSNNGADELIVCIGGGRFVARGNSSVVACGNSSVEARGNSSVVARGNSSVEACGNSSVEAWDNSSVEARGNSSVEAWDNSSVEARGNSSVVAWGNSSVEARDNSSVEACGNSSVEAWDNSSVVARGNSSVEACGNSFTRALGYGTVKAGSHAVVLQHSDEARISGGQILKAHKPKTGQEWCDFYGVEVEGGVATLFKAVRADFGTRNGVAYVPGTEPEAPDWDGGKAECGGGLHFSPHPKMAREFNPSAEHFVACPVRVEDIVVHPDGSMPEKVKAPRCCAPVFEVDKDGRKIAEDDA